MDCNCERYTPCLSQRTEDGKALHQGETVEVRGWVRTVRDQKQFCFMQVNDGSNMSGIQVVVEPGAAGFELIADGKVQTGGRCGQAWLHITLLQLHTCHMHRCPLLVPAHTMACTIILVPSSHDELAQHVAASVVLNHLLQRGSTTASVTPPHQPWQQQCTA